MRRARFGELDARIVGGADGDGGGSGPVVVLLHGFGAPGDDLVPLARMMAAPEGTRFVMPEAPLSLGAAYFGGRAWWWLDLEERVRRQATGERDIDEVPAGLDEARAKVEGLLDAVEAVLRPPLGKTVLGGFSQGAMLSLDAALRSSRSLAGIVLLSGTHLAAPIWADRFAARRGLPIFMSHGMEDPLLPFAIADHLRVTLESAGFPVEWVPFRGGHGIPPEVLDRAGDFVRRVLAAP